MNSSSWRAIIEARCAKVSGFVWRSENGDAKKSIWTREVEIWCRVNIYADELVIFKLGFQSQVDTNLELFSTELITNLGSAIALILVTGNLSESRLSFKETTIQMLGGKKIKRRAVNLLKKKKEKKREKDWKEQNGRDGKRFK